MAEEFPFKLNQILDLPESIEGIGDSLTSLWDRIGFINLTKEFIDPGLPPGEDVEPEEIEELEAFEFLEFFEGEEESDPPEDFFDTEDLLPARPTESVKSRLKLDLEALEDLEVKFPGIDGLSLSTPAGGFQVTSEVNDGVVRVDASLKLALRVKPNLLKPVRRVVGEGGVVKFETDHSRPFTEIDLGEVEVSATSSGKVDISGEARLVLSDPVMITPLGLVIENAEVFIDLSGEDKCLGFKWYEVNINRILNTLPGNIEDRGTIAESEVTLRMIFGDAGNEIRLDWALEGNPRKLTLPAVQISTPGSATYTLLIQGQDDVFEDLSFLVSLKKDALFTAQSTFAWERDESSDDAVREVHNDEERDPEKEPFFKLDVKAKNDLSLQLVKFDLAGSSFPTFFKQLTEPLPPIDFSDQVSLCKPTSFTPESLSSSNWDVDLDVNPDDLPFELPFLKQKEKKESSEPSDFDQFLSLDKKIADIDINFDEHTISCPLKVGVHIGSITLESEFGIAFNWESIAVKLDHSAGIQFVSDEEELPKTPVEHMGLSWRFKGAKTEDGRFHYFTLATKNNNYQLQQAKGAVFEVDYTKASKDPISFEITDFALAAKGINMTAEVLDRPARLNGIDTKFRFSGSKLVIVENQILDFTLAGSGPLPPDLVGQATVDIALQFQQRNGNLTLVAGHAKLRGNKLLDCRATRFQFQVDAIGLKFVNDGKFHLYFTLTGFAQYAPLPSDDSEGPLALLPSIKIALVECPLTGDASVIAKHVNFLIELPEKVSFSFLGCFNFELRAIGFQPQSEVFGGDAAMQLTGQVMFSKGGHDVLTARVDFHGLFVGVPRRGEFIPRLSLKNLAVEIKYGAAFQLSGSVSFVDDELQRGFMGQGMLQMQGMPTLAATFSFLRVRKDETSRWLRAWFIFIEVRQVSFLIPLINIYLREVGLGFGYRYTLAAIKAADLEEDVRKLLQELKKLSRTAGELSKFDRWALDLEDPGESPRWTIVFRAMMSQTSASPSPLKWNPSGERNLSCTFLFDAVIAFRSDLTFFMAVRAWLNTNYHDFVTDNEGLREAPLLSGFVYFSAHRKRFLANFSSNPDGKVGPHPPFPEYVKRAIANSQFSVTLLIEPGLFHYEMGWPNMLRWKDKIGPVQAEFRGGFIFRVSKRELVMGQSFLARGSLEINNTFNFGFMGLTVSALAKVAYGARYIGVLAFKNTIENSAIYGAVGLELRIRFSILFWIRIKIGFVKITFRFRFSFSIGFTASLELGLGLGVSKIGARGRGTLSVSFMGHGFHLKVKVGINEDAVERAINITEKFLNVGLEATDVEPVPGTLSAGSPAAASRGLQIEAPAMTPIRAGRSADASVMEVPFTADTPIAMAEAVELNEYSLPEYSIFIRNIPDDDGWIYFSLVPKGEEETGFLPAPPVSFLIKDAFSTGLDNGELSQELRDKFNLYGVTLASDASVEVLNAGIQWQVTTDESVFAIGKVGSDPFLRVALQVENDFAFHIPIGSVDVSISGAFIANFDENNITDELSAAFLELRFDISGDAQIVTIEAGERWRIDDEGQQYDAWFVAATNTIRIVLHDDLVIEQFLPLGDQVGWVDQSQNRGETIRWSAAWDTTSMEMTTLTPPPGSNTDELQESDYSESQPRPLSLGQFIRNAYKTQVVEDADIPVEFELDTVVTTGDPVIPGLSMESLEDDRVQNPTDNAYESAVRGAIEQFQGSPYFKKDPNNEYEKALSNAFEDSTTIYSSDGQVPDDNDVLRDLQDVEQAVQTRGLVVQDLVMDVNDYATAGSPDERDSLSANSIGFQMGLVFRTRVDQLPDWLERLPAPEEKLTPTISQRPSPLAVRPDESSLKDVTTFNISTTNFSLFSPQFERVKHFTDADTIAIAWKLVWSETPDPGCSRCQADPEHHLRHYEVRRRALDGKEQEVVFTVKNAEVLYLTPGTTTEDAVIERLRPRFQIVDHFTEETLDDQVTLPVEGRTYLYTITPKDLAGNAGRPLTVVATRRPNQPPQVPVDGELKVGYTLEESFFQPVNKPTEDEPNVALPDTIDLVTPTDIEIRWTEPLAPKEGPEVPIETYRLVFRKAVVLPLGSYGLDGSTQSSTHKSLPTSNARPLPTDLKITITPDGPRESRFAKIPIDALQSSGIYPAGESPEWEPTAWHVFFQTVSVNGVASALTPINVLIKVESNLLDEVSEIRRPPHLEWLPRHLLLPLLPPEDQRAVTGTAHFPMPEEDGLFNGTLSNTSYQVHPTGIRCIRFRWNRSPNAQSNYPININAGYTLLELDIDAETTQTFGNRGALNKALRELQEVQMLPANELLLSPGDTLTTSQWEAWYPSEKARRRVQSENGEESVAGSEIARGPWYSWRESYLEWPAWRGLTDVPPGQAELEVGIHPVLDRLIDALEVDPEGLLESTYIVDLQVSPPTQDGTLETLFNNTDVKSDPYGWSILQRLGLSVTLSLRKQPTAEDLREGTLGDLISGEDLLGALQDALTAYQDQPIYSGEDADPELMGAFYKFLHVETLFQPSQSVSLEPQSTEGGSMLGIIQVSLRPTINQYLYYSEVSITAPAGEKIELEIHLPEGEFLTILNQADLDSGETELEGNESGLIKHNLFMPLTGKTRLILRHKQPEAPLIGFEEGSTAAMDPAFERVGPVPIAVNDERTPYFTTPDNLVDVFVDEANTAGGISWFRFKRYAEYLNSGTDGAPQIEVPITKEAVEPVLPVFLAWAQRFFDFSGDVGEIATASRPLFATTQGPWMATAYPHSTRPVYVSPDNNGRLKYDYLLEDKWAHTYRYYIRPFGRYELLWQSLLESRTLFPETPSQQKEAAFATADPASAALDVVLDREHPVAMPLVLSTNRLDEPANPGSPPSPGKTWEVLVAQHPEQELMSRNQTLFRQLSFRGISFTLLRRFAMPAWIDDFESELKDYNSSEEADYQFELNLIADEYPAGLPLSYPDHPDHIDFSNVDVDERLSLDLPLRLGAFRQGAMALHWEALPFFYEHKVLLVAQSTTQVSPINEVVQRDFEYKSPDPTGLVEGIEKVDWRPISLVENDIPETSQSLPMRLRKVDIPMRRFWDCLSADAQLQWQFEKPDEETVTEKHRKLSSIPDPGVVYQIASFISGNIEVQSELFVQLGSEEDPEVKAHDHYDVRQLGKEFLTSIFGITPPPGNNPQADFILSAELLQLTQETLKGLYNKSRLPFPTSHKIGFDDLILVLAGVMTSPDHAHLLIEFIQKIVDSDPVLAQRIDPVPSSGDLDARNAFIKKWYATSSVNSTPVIPAELQDRVSYIEDGLNSELPSSLSAQLTLSSSAMGWSGSLTTYQRNDLLGHKSDLFLFNDAANRLVSVLDGAAFNEPYDVPPARPHPDSKNLPGTFAIEVTYPPDPDPVWVLQWTGMLTSRERDQLQNLRGDTAFLEGIDNLVAEIDQQTFRVQVDLNVTITESIPQFAILPPNPLETLHTLVWVGSMTEDQFDELLGLSTNNTYRDAVRKLQGLVEAFYTNRRFEQTIPFEWPRIDPNLLTALIDVDFSALAVDAAANRLRWLGIGNMNVTASDIKRRLPNCFEAQDPGLAALNALLDQIIDASHEVQFAFGRLLRIDGQLIEAERDQLLTLFNASDGPALERLFVATHDKLKIDVIHDDWYSKVLVSNKPQSLFSDTGITDDLLQLSSLVDCQDPDEMEIVWSGGPMDDTTKQLLKDLEGDDAFQDAIDRLIELSDTMNGVDEEISVLLSAHPESIPELFKSRLTLQSENANYVQLLFMGHLFTEEEERLQNWAQVPELTEAIEALISRLNSKAISIELDVEVPSSIREFVQIYPGKLAWVGATLSDTQAEQLKRITVDDFTTEIRNQLAQKCVATILIDGLNPRPSSSELPAILQNNLVIQPNSVTWNGRLATPAQLTALEQLAGDTSFQEAITEIIDRLTRDVESIDLSLPVRPQQQDLPVELKEALLLGRFVLRFHGLMTQEEGELLLNAYPDLPDKRAIVNLYEDAVQRGMRGKSLKIRARRGSATPSATIDLASKTLEIPASE